MTHPGGDHQPQAGQKDQSAFSDTSKLKKTYIKSLTDEFPEAEIPTMTADCGQKLARAWHDFYPKTLLNPDDPVSQSWQLS